MPVITCQCPGCNAIINYQKGSEKIPLYCPLHIKGREERGYRYPNAVDSAKPIGYVAPKKTPLPKRAILICHKCKKRVEVSYADLVAGEKDNICCGKKMIYHKDVEAK